MYQQFLTNYNGKVAMDISRPSMDVFVDASLAGVGAKWNEMYMHPIILTTVVVA